MSKVYVVCQVFPAIYIYGYNLPLGALSFPPPVAPATTWTWADFGTYGELGSGAFDSAGNIYIVTAGTAPAFLGTITDGGGANVPANNSTLTIRGVTYTWKTVLTAPSGYPGEVLIVTGAGGADASLTNMVNAVNGLGAGVPGVDYDSSTPANPYASMSAVASGASKILSLVHTSVAVSLGGTTHCTLSGLSAGNLPSNSGAGAILKITPSGTQSYVVTASWLNGICLTMDPAGNFYGVNFSTGSIVKYSSSGAGPITVDGRNLSRVDNQQSMAIDGSGNLVAVVYNSVSGYWQLVKYSIPSYSITVLANFTPAGGFPTGLTSFLPLASKICFDAAGNIYVPWIPASPPSFTSYIAKFTSGGTLVSNSFATMSSTSVDVAYDPISQQFIVGQEGLDQGVITVLNSSGHVVSPAAFMLGTILGPYNINTSIITNNTLTISVDGGSPVTVTLPTGTAITIATVVSTINAALGSAIASSYGGYLLLTSTTTGSGSEIFLGAGSNAAVTLGLSYNVYVQGGNLADISVSSQAGPGPCPIVANPFPIIGPGAPSASSWQPGPYTM